MMSFSLTFARLSSSRATSLAEATAGEDGSAFRFSSAVVLELAAGDSWSGARMSTAYSARTSAVFAAVIFADLESRCALLFND